MITITDRAVAKAKFFKEKMGAQVAGVCGLVLQVGGCAG